MELNTGPKKYIIISWVIVHWQWPTTLDQPLKLTVCLSFADLFTYQFISGKRIIALNILVIHYMKVGIGPHKIWYNILLYDLLVPQDTSSPDFGTDSEWKPDKLYRFKIQKDFIIVTSTFTSNIYANIYNFHLIYSYRL
jgi:hypothetical protein